MRGSWVIRDGELVDKKTALIRDAVAATQSRSDLPCPYVISDIGEYRSMVDGSIISGRRQHRDHLRAHGCIEVGNEKMEPSVKVNVDSAEIARDVKTAIEQVKAGYIPPDTAIGSIDENGDVIEKPEISIDATGVKDGDYIRAEAASAE